MTAGPYLYPGTDILINKEGIRDADELSRFESEVTANRMEHLPRDIPITYEAYRRIHRYIFEPVYEWAGEARTVNITKGNEMFCLVPHIASQVERRFGVELVRVDPDAWIDASIRSFRDGDYEPMRRLLAGAVVASG